MGACPRHLVVTGGNHDSASRLDAPRDLLGALSITVVGGHEQAREADLLVPIRDGDALLGVVAAVPYVNEYRLGVNVRADNPHAAAVAAFSGLYSRLADRAEALFPGVPRVATGHLTCSTRLSVPSHSVSDDPLSLSAEDFPLPVHCVGTLGALPPTIFDPRWGYVALGHIHRCLPPEAPRVWYSGTPVAMGFTELTPRRVLLVDLDGADSPPRVTPLTPPTLRGLHRLRGTPDDVLAELARLRDDPLPLPPLVDVTLSVRHYQPELRHRLMKPLDGDPRAPILVAMRQEPLAAADAGGRVTHDGTAVEALAPAARRSPWELFEAAWIRKHGPPPGPDVRAAFESLLSAQAPES